MSGDERTVFEKGDVVYLSVDGLWMLTQDPREWCRHNNPTVISQDGAYTLVDCGGRHQWAETKHLILVSNGAALLKIVEGRYAGLDVDTISLVEGHFNG